MLKLHIRASIAFYTTFLMFVSAMFMFGYTGHPIYAGMGVGLGVGAIAIGIRAILTGVKADRERNG